MSDTPTPLELRRLGDRRTEFDVARRRRDDLAATSTAAALRLAEAEATVAALRIEGAAPAQVSAATKRVAAARTAATKAGRAVAAADAKWTQIRDRLDDTGFTRGDPAKALASGVPVALLPVRLETRFVGDELRVRIFPDTLHIDQLEPLLTTDEIDAGQRYWKERWTTANADAQALWERSLGSTGRQRFAYIVEQTTPTNVSSRGAGAPQFPALVSRTGPTRAPRATMLPARWVVVGRRGDTEVFRVSGQAVRDPLPVAPAPIGASGPATVPTDDVQPALALDADSRWIADYDAAVAAGMAVTVSNADVAGGNVRAGFDRVIAVGIDHRSDPATSAGRLEGLLRAHHVTDGIGFVDHGTATNATDEDDVAGRPAAGDPTLPVPTPTSTSAAGRVAAAFGLPAGGIVSRFSGSERDHDPLAEAMLTALWEPTLGYFANQMMAPVVGADRVADIRDHVRRHVRGRGPLPLLRVGDQPLGLLPVVATRQFAGNATETYLGALVTGLRTFWAHSLGAARQLGGSGDPAADLVTLLQRTERSGSYRVREAVGATMVANTVGLGPLAQLQQAVAQLVLAMHGVAGRPRLVDITLSDDEIVAPIPMVTVHPLSETAPLTPDYIATVRSRTVHKFGYKQLRDDPENASSLLEALLIHAGQLEFGRAGIGFLVKHLDPEHQMTIEVAAADPEFASGYERRPDSPPPLEITDEPHVRRFNVTVATASDYEVRAVSGNTAIGSWLAEASQDLLIDFPEAQQFAEFRDALAVLTGRPTAELHRAATDALDVASHRFDAWATSLATRRLAAQRAKAPSGVHVGAFGWVDDLRPAVARASAGYVHAPSIAQATTAAILRSGHLARTDAAAEPLAIDLTSRRVRDAATLLEGMRSGQSLAALLGYRFERGVRDAGMTLAKYILPSRLTHPLAGSGDRPIDTTAAAQPTEAIAARNVVDGVALAELDAAGRDAFLAAIKADAVDRAALRTQLEALTDSLDAVGDLLISDSVYHAVIGNTERAAAALDALDRLGPLPEVGVSRIPRSGRGIAHRLLVLLEDRSAPTAWNASNDLRAKAEPAVNAWVGAVLGDPQRFAFTAAVVDDDDGSVTGTVTCDLADLQLSPLSTVLAATQSGAQQSELEQRILATLAGKAAVPITSLRVDPKRVAPLTSIAGDLADLLGSARAATVDDLLHPTERAAQAPDVAELAGRADVVVKAVRTLAATFDARRRSRSNTVLADAAALGLRDAVVPADAKAAGVQVRRLVDEAKTLASRLDALESTFASQSAPSPFAQAEFHCARIRAVLGEQIPVVPRFTVPAATQQALDRSLADSALLDGRRAAVPEWVLQHTRVRAAVERLWRVIATAEARETGVDATEFVAAQLPARVGDPWIARPESFKSGPPVADTSFVFHRTATGALGTTVAALLVDQWYEHIAATTETTGLSLHYDAPGSRAPQTVVLAVHPDPAATTWTTSLLVDTVDECADQAKMRMLDLDDVTAAGRFLPAIYAAFNIEREVPSLDVSTLIVNAVAAKSQMVIG